MGKTATTTWRGKFDGAFESCAIAALIAIASIGGTHAFGARLGIVVNNASTLAE